MTVRVIDNYAPQPDICPVCTAPLTLYGCTFEQLEGPKDERAALLAEILREFGSPEVVFGRGKCQHPDRCADCGKVHPRKLDT